jgi:hypothetical protein
MTLGLPGARFGSVGDAVRIAATLVLIFAFGQSLKAQSESQSVQGQPSPKEAAAPVQPIPYSHKKHLALGLKCEMCHTNPAPGILMTFPATGKCMQCHTEVAKDSEAIQKLSAYEKDKQQVPWVRIYAVPAWVYWNHRQHIQAGTNCEACHGRVAEMDKMKLATNVTTMQGCVDCHKQRDAPVGCASCHENTSTQ